MERPGHVDVVIRIRVGGVGMHAEQNGPNRQAKRIQSDGDAHGVAA
jgi:hypothetical protein